MKTMRWAGLCLWVLGLPAAALAQDYEEGGDEEVRAGSEPPRRTLAERIPAVSGRLFIKRGRAELIPTVGLSLNDPFFDHILISGAANYHVLESLWVGVGADLYGSISSAVPVAGGGSARPPRFNHPIWAGHLEVGWAPVYGKLSLLAEGVFHFDAYVAVGAGVIGPSDGSPAFGGTVAVGQRYFLNEWMAIKLELRDQIFPMARIPSINDEQSWQNLMSATLGVCFFVPPTFEREKL